MQKMIHEAASTSPLALNHTQNMAPNWHITTNDLVHQFSTAANDVVYSLVSLVVSTEHTLASIATHFDIYSFAHHIPNKNLIGCTIILHPHGFLEIRRPDSEKPSNFPVMRRNQPANDERYAIAA